MKKLLAHREFTQAFDAWIYGCDTQIQLGSIALNNKLSNAISE